MEGRGLSSRQAQYLEKDPGDWATYKLHNGFRIRRRRRTSNKGVRFSFSVGDFIPVARINYSPWVFVAKPDAPFGGTIKGMADWAKANPDKLLYSSDNVNGPTHIVFLLMEYQPPAGNRLKSRRLSSATRSRSTFRGKRTGNRACSMLRSDASKTELRREVPALRCPAVTCNVS